MTCAKVTCSTRTEDPVTFLGNLNDVATSVYSTELAMDERAQLVFWIGCVSVVMVNDVRK